MRLRNDKAWAFAVLFVLACATGPLTIEEERRLGAEQEQAARREFDFVRDKVTVGYVADLGQALLRAMGPQPFDYDFYVIDDDTLNAFAMPAGNIYVHTGLILKARNVSELIGVMGHEIGHVHERHIAENYRRRQNTGLLQTLGVWAIAIFQGPQAAQAADILTSVGAIAYLNTFSRDAEREADAFAVQTVPKAGYDPSGITSFFATLVKEYGNSGNSFLSSHPATQERIDNTKRMIAAAQLPSRLRQDDDGKLEIIQHRIRMLTGKTKPK